MVSSKLVKAYENEDAAIRSDRYYIQGKVEDFLEGRRPDMINYNDSLTGCERVFTPIHCSFSGFPGLNEECEAIINSVIR